MSYIKNIYQDIREKTKGMSFLEKADYLWEYYRLAFFLITFISISIITVGGTIIGNSLKKPVLNVGVLNSVNFYYDDDINALLESAFPDAKKRTAPQVYSFSSPSDESNMYAAIQLAAYLGADTIDCGIVDTDCLEYLTNTERPMEIIDISDAKLGRAMEGHGLKPLYYFYFKDTDRADAAALFGTYIISQD